MPLFRFVLFFLVLFLGILQALPALAGVYIAQPQDRFDPTQGERPTVVVAFDEPLRRATVTIKAEDGSFEKSWNYERPRLRQEFRVEWSQPEGELGYEIFVDMVNDRGEEDREQTFVYVTVASPLTASIPPESVDLAGRSFDLVTNHPPTHVELEVMADNQKILGSSTFEVEGAVLGKPVRVPWEQNGEGNLFRIVARAHDAYGYWAEVEIIPWSLSIPHEDVHFETGSHAILGEEMPKVDRAWIEIDRAVAKYGAWVDCTLYVAGYTDTVGDSGSNQSLSGRRALSIAKAFRSRGASFPIFYRGYGESVLAVPTGDATDEVRNRRALYIITAGPPPRGGDTPGGAWQRLP